MTYDLFIGDRTFSSWSMRGWLMCAAFDIPHRTHMVGLYGGTMAEDLAPLAPARLVPVLRTPKGTVVQDTLAMAETLADRFPDAGLWPTDPEHRATARWLVAEMHSGFGALRGECPMNLGAAYGDFDRSDEVLKDVKRVEELWSLASGYGDGWLFGAYSLADVFYAPVAARIATYGIPVSDRARAYVDRHLAHTLFRQWRAMGLTKTYQPNPYPSDATAVPWPGPAPLAAKPTDDGSDCINATCPYSGKAVTDFLQIGGRTYGFCNSFCRDKTVNDPEAWPAFMAIYQS